MYVGGGVCSLRLHQVVHQCIVFLQPWALYVLLPHVSVRTSAWDFRLWTYNPYLAYYFCVPQPGIKLWTLLKIL